MVNEVGLPLFKVNGTTILKSGSDFRQFSKITINFKTDPLDIETDIIDVCQEVDKDEEMVKCLEEYSGISL